MADQFTDLGFIMNQPDAMDRFFASAWADKQLIDLDGAVYLRIDTEPHIQAWLSISPEDQSLLDWELHFAADHQCGVAFDADLALDDADQSGNVRMLLNPGENELPIVASVPALAYWPDREPGSPGLAQLACYAESLTVQPNNAAENLLADAAEPQAIITGRVTACESCVNGYTHQPFWHVTLTCCGNTLDVLLSDALTAHPLAVDEIIQVKCRITAMVESGVIA